MNVSSIVDEWMKDANEAIQTTQMGIDTNIAQDISSSKGRIGLGFENKSKATEGSRFKNDALLEKLKKSKKRKQNDNKELSSSSVITHGLVEDDEELESRIKIVSTLGKKAIDAQEPAITASSNHKKQKIDTSNNHDNIHPKPIASTDHRREVNQSPNEKDAIVVYSKAPSNKYEIVNSNDNQNRFAQNLTTNISDNGGAVKKKKRIKTRSKQKNIRRDNRPDDKKPSHLKFGSKDYLGRPITPQTREKLSLPPKKSRDANFNHRNQFNSD